MKKYCGIVKRVVAWLLDTIFQLAILAGVIVLLDVLHVLPVYEMKRIQELVVTWEFLKITSIAAILFAFLYGWFGEALPCRATLGKLIVGIRVERSNGAKAKGIDIITRNMIKQIPNLGLYFSYLVVSEMFLDVKYASCYSLKTIGKALIDYESMLEGLQALDVVTILKVSFLALLLIKWIWPLFGKKHRAIHDLFAGTVLVNRKYKEAEVSEEPVPEMGMNQDGFMDQQMGMNQGGFAGQQMGMNQGGFMNQQMGMDQGGFAGQQMGMNQGGFMNQQMGMDQNAFAGQEMGDSQDVGASQTEILSYDPMAENEPKNDTVNGSMDETASNTMILSEQEEESKTDSPVDDFSMAEENISEEEATTAQLHTENLSQELFEREEPVETQEMTEEPVETQTMSEQPAVEIPVQTPVALQLHALSGVFAGGIWKLNVQVVFGRDQSQCNMVFGANEEGISRVHCRLTPMGEQVLFEDLNSSYGGWFNDAEKIMPGQQRMLSVGDRFTIGNLQTFAIEKME